MPATPCRLRYHLPACLTWLVAALIWPSAAPLAAEPADQGAAASQPNADPIGMELFERKIRPLLDQHCSSCHGRDRQKGGLSLASRETMLAGGESGAVVVPGKPDESVLIEAVGYEGDVQMPPSGKLSAGEIAALREWIGLGAPWPASPP